MDLQGRNLRSRMRGEDVELLQRELRLLGFSIEDEAGVFGRTTRHAVEQIQERHSFEMTGEVDERTAKAINSEVSALSSLEGHVFADSGLPAASAALRIYNRGFEGLETQLGEVETNSRGHYQLSYDAGARKANLEVRLVDASGQEIPLSGTKYNAGRSEVMNLVAPAGVLALTPEYHRISADLDKELGGLAKLSQAQESERRPDLSVLHQATGWDARLIALAALAVKSSVATGMSNESLYGLFRTGLPTDIQQLALVSADSIEKALKKANDAQVIGLQEREISKAKAAFASFSRTARLAIKAPGTSSSFGGLLDTCSLAGEEREKFEDMYFSYGESPTKFWQETRKELLNLARNREHVDEDVEAKIDDKLDELRLRGKIAYLTLNNVELTESLSRETRSLDQLVQKGYHKAATWKDHLKTLAGGDDERLAQLIPPAYTGETTAQRLNAFTADLSRKIHLSFPTQVITQMVKDKEISPAGPANGIEQERVVSFLHQAEKLGFELGQVPVGQFIKDHQDLLLSEETSNSEQDEIEACVEQLQRWYQLTPSDTALRVVADLGFTSAQDIVAYSYSEFMGRFADDFSSEIEQQLVYRKAQQIVAVTFNLVTMASQLARNPAIFAMFPPAESPPEARREQAKANLIKQYPSLELLFGSLDFCECEHCRSVLSPAAYMVDLLKFLDPDKKTWEATTDKWLQRYKADYPFKDQAAVKRWKDNNPGEEDDPLKMTPYGVLTSRRPDLPHLPLTCENTKTILPYIDVVNEILEYYVANGDLGPQAVFDTGQATTAELLAEPQNIEPKAYAKLRESECCYPLNLPYDFWLESVRRFFNHFEAPLYQVMETFRPKEELFSPNGELTEKGDYYRAAIFAEQLGISPAEHQIFTGFDAKKWFKLYGYKDENEASSLGYDEDGQHVGLYSAKTLSRRLGVRYKELIEIVQTGYVNPELDTLAIVWKLGVNVSDIVSYIKNKEKPEYATQTELFETRLKRLLAKMLPNLDDEAILSKFDELQSNISGLQEDFHKILVLKEKSGLGNFEETHLEYADPQTPVKPLDFLKINLFVRLWKKLGWTIEETDQALQIFMPENSKPMTGESLRKAIKTVLVYLAHFKVMEKQVKTGKNNRLNLMTLWSNLPTAGKNSLYAQFFLSKKVLMHAPIFDNPMGHYLCYFDRGTNKHEPFHWNPQDEIDAEKGNVSLESQLVVVQGALGLTADDIERILAESNMSPDTAALSINTVSLLYRYRILAKALGLSMRELITLKKLSGLNPFRELEAYPLSDYPRGDDEISPLEADYPYNETLKFIELTKTVDESNFNIEDLNYLFRHQIDPVGKYRSSAEIPFALVKSLAEDIQRLHTEIKVSAEPALPTADLLRKHLSLLLPAEKVDLALGVLTNIAEYKVSQQNVEAQDQLDPENFMQELRLRVSYDGVRKIQHLAYSGLITDADVIRLKDANTSPVFENLLDTVQAESRECFVEKLQSVLELTIGTTEYRARKSNVEVTERLESAILLKEPGLRISYDKASRAQCLAYRGLLSDTRKSELTAADTPPFLLTLLDDVQDQAKTVAKKLVKACMGVVTGMLGLTASQQRDCIADLRIGFLKATEFDSIFAEMKDIASNAEEAGTQLARAIAPFLQQKHVRQQIMQRLAIELGAEPNLVDALLCDDRLLTEPGQVGKPMLDAFSCVGEKGVSAAFYDSPDCTGNPRIADTTVKNVDTGIRRNDKRIVPEGVSSARFHGVVQVPISGAYRFSTFLGRPGTKVELRFGHRPTPILQGELTDDEGDISQFVELEKDVPYPFTFSIFSLNIDTVDGQLNGDVKLLVQGENLEKGDLDQLTLYPMANIERFRHAHLLLVKALQIIQGLALSEREVRYLVNHATDFDNLSLSDLPTRSNSSSSGAVGLFRRFLRLSRYARLKQRLSAGTDDLVNVLESSCCLHLGEASAEKAKRAHFEPMARLTRRDSATIQATVDSLGFAINVSSIDGDCRVETPDLGHERGVSQLWAALQIVEKLGIPAKQVVDATRLITDSEKPNDIAQNLRNAVKARYETEDWRLIAKPIFNKLRQNQRDALVSYVLHNHRENFKSVEQLFEYFLIDPGMEPVVETSRIRLAISSIQLFVQRCLLNLEPHVHPTVINSQQFQWMKRYRYWEANRKIFLFPENWLEPEFRDDKTHLFQELENALLQGDISNELAENALFDYLKKFEEIARLEIVTAYLEENTNGTLNTLHVIGRTHNLPHKYFYRRYAHRMWTPWEPITVDIEGDHVVAVVWRDRLHLFWVTFIEKAKEDQPNLVVADEPYSDPIEQRADTIEQIAIRASKAKPKMEVEVQLNWSECFKGEWSARTTSAPIKLTPSSKKDFTVSDFSATDVSIQIVEENTDAFGSVVNVVLGPPFDQALSVKNKNCPPEGPSKFPIGFKTPYHGLESKINKFEGDYALAVKATFTGLPRARALISGKSHFELVMTGKSHQMLNSQVEALNESFFYQDSRYTFFAKPFYSETLIKQFEGFGIAPRTPKPWLENKDVWEKWVQIVPREPIVKIDPGWVCPIDSLAQFNIQPIDDWLTGTNTLLQFDQSVVGTHGGMELIVSPNMSEYGPVVDNSYYHELTAGETSVGPRGSTFRIAGSVVSGHRVTVVGSGGLNETTLENMVTRDRLAGRPGLPDANIEY